MHGVSAHTGFPRTLTVTNYISAVLSTLNPILSVTNLSRLECAEPSVRGNAVHTSIGCGPRLPRVPNHNSFHNGASL